MEVQAPLLSLPPEGEVSGLCVFFQSCRGVLAAVSHLLLFSREVRWKCKMLDAHSTPAPPSLLGESLGVVCFLPILQSPVDCRKLPSLFALFLTLLRHSNDTSSLSALGETGGKLILQTMSEYGACFTLSFPWGRSLRLRQAFLELSYAVLWGREGWDYVFHHLADVILTPHLLLLRDMSKEKSKCSNER